MTRWYQPIVLIFLSIPVSARAEDWPGWRGPRGDGTSLENKLPLRWSATENIHWKTPIPGKGHSSPIVFGDRIFLTTCLEQEKKRVLLCLDRRTGKVLWKRVVLTAKLEDKHGLNSFASSTPVTDGKHVWVSFLDDPHARLACYDYEGNQLWTKSPGEFHSKHGFCSCPILHNGKVILNCDQDAVAYIVALDKATGEEQWRIDRPNRTRSYCPPLIVSASGKMQMVLSGSKCVTSYDPDTGKQHWIIDGPTEQFVASMVYLDDVLFLTAGYPTYHLLAIRPDGMGNVTKSHVLWHKTKGAGYVPSPVAWGKSFFVVTDDGIASGWNAKTGSRHWMERLGTHHSASPIVGAGHLYFTDDAGITYVLKAETKYEEVFRNDLGEECYSSPAVAQGQVFIRTLHHLWCIGKQ